MEENRQNKMGTMPIFRLIVTMSIPAVLSMMVQALYNIVDSYFVAQISENALTSVSLVFPVQTLLIAVAVGTGVGLNSLIARRLGENRREEADQAATHGLLLGLANGLLFFVIGLFCSGPFLRAFTSDPEIVSMGSAYMSTVCMFSFGACVEINIEKILQATGNMVFPMIFQLIGAVGNMLLDPVFIFGLFGVPAMGVRGAAIATVIAQILSMVVALLVLLFREHEVKVDFHFFRVNWRTVQNIYAVGLPAIVMQSTGSVMVVGMNAILIGFTGTAVAVFGVYFKLQSFVFMPVFGLNQGLMPVMGYNYGARKISRLLSAVKIGCAIAAVIMGIGMAGFWLIPDKLLLIFNASGRMLQIGVPALRTISLCFLPAAFGIVFSTTFQAVGDGVKSLIISLLRQLVILLPCAYLLSKIGLDAVWFAFPAAESVSLAASIFLYCSVRRTTIQTGA
ncbi:MATE family efflux transporter [Caproicibacter sp. BJN0012]|uniref:MATE family efflux transporter n=1 Tax=Caproicibacter sp. BJN0012 TaxID=3110227 RepID=UPI002E12FEB5